MVSGTLIEGQVVKINPYYGFETYDIEEANGTVHREVSPYDIETDYWQTAFGATVLFTLSHEEPKQ